MPFLNGSPRIARRGFSMIEAVVATVLLGSLCAILFPVLSRLLVVQQEVDQRQFALRELRNMVERGLFFPEDTAPLLRPAIQDELPDARLDVDRSQDDANGERVELTMSWDAGASRPRSEVQLVYWVPKVEAVQ